MLCGQCRPAGWLHLLPLASQGACSPASRGRALMSLGRGCQLLSQASSCLSGSGSYEKGAKDTSLRSRDRGSACRGFPGSPSGLLLCPLYPSPLSGPGLLYVLSADHLPLGDASMRGRAGHPGCSQDRVPQPQVSSSKGRGRVCCRDQGLTWKNRLFDPVEGMNSRGITWLRAGTTL